MPTFAESWSPAGWFPLGWFPAGWFPGSTSTSDLPADLAAAIAARYAASPGLVAASTGIYRDRAKATAEYPYLVFALDLDRAGLQTSSSTWNDSRARFDAFATTSAGAEALATLVRDEFDGANFSYRSGLTTPFVAGSPTGAALAGRGKGGVRAWRSRVVFRFSARVGRP